MGVMLLGRNRRRFCNVCGCVLKVSETYDMVCGGCRLRFSGKED